MTFRQQLTKARGDKSKKEFAQTLGISPQMLSRLENGNRKPSYSLLIRIAGILGLDIAEVVQDIGSPGIVEDDVETIEEGVPAGSL